MAKPKVVEIPVNTIRIAKFHWNRNHSKEEVARLADEIASVGLINPITIMIRDTRPILIAGEKRFRACRDVLKWTEIPAIILPINDKEAELVSIYENLGQSGIAQTDHDAAVQRALEIEAARKALPTTNAKVIESVAIRSNVSSGEVRRASKRATKLIPEVKDALKEEKISKSQATAIAAAPQGHQKQLLREARKGTSSEDLWGSTRLIANKKEDEELVNVRKAKRFLSKCITAGKKMRNEIELFEEFVKDHKVKIHQLGRVKQPEISEMIKSLERVQKILDKS